MVKYIMVQTDVKLPDSNAALKDRIALLESENELLRQEVNLLRHRLFGRKSEKESYVDVGYEPRSLFDTEVAQCREHGEEDNENIEEISIPAHIRKKKGRSKLSPLLPRTEIVHDLPSEEKVCKCGAQKSCIGYESSEKLEMVPAAFWVFVHKYLKYVCLACEGVENDEGKGAVQIAPRAPQLLPKTISTPSLLAHLFVSKFCDSLPFYRQEKQFERYGVTLTRGTMCRWAINASEYFVPLLEQLRQKLLSGPLIQIDETRMQVLSEDGRNARDRSYMWVMRGGPPGKVMVLYHYNPRRNAEVAASLIGNYQGVVQTDGYVGYDFLDKRPGIIHVGCWAHARRKFKEVKIALGKSFSPNNGPENITQTALDYIRELYNIEDKAKWLNLSPEETVELRRKESEKKLGEFKDWLDEHSPKIPPKSILGQAFFYTLSQWHRLKKYLESGYVGMDNNMIENAIRPFVVGRKNWLFSETPAGAKATAVIYSLIETAKANQLDPYNYFLYLIDKLPTMTIDRSVELWQQLLPTNLDNEFLKDYKHEYLKHKKCPLIS